MKRSGVILFAVTALMFLGASALAWQPSGWVYHAGTYAYSTEEGEWYYFNSVDTQWRVNLASGVWDKLTDATGWNYHQWPYAYSIDTPAWFWFNTTDVQWCNKLTSGQWTKFGEPSVPTDMALIPAGSFSMGDSLGDAWENDEVPVHTVYVSAFYMDKYEVTKAKWDGVYTWAITNGYTFSNTGSVKAVSHPVHTVNWYDCVKWCNARSQKEGLTPFYTVGLSVYKTGKENPECNWNANGYRLPTEAEWEYAARGGGSGQRFPWGATINHSYANYDAYGKLNYDTSPYTEYTYHPDYDDGGLPYTSPVGAFDPNGYRLYDMVGNVREFCNDWYGSYAAGSVSNPHGPAAGVSRVTRGGSFYSNAVYSRVTDRFKVDPSGKTSGRGFRSVR
jgi:formylglycine-generating enzyme required for sulfatase activity